MKRTATAVRFAVAISVVVFLAHANAQPSIAAIDTALRTAVERGDVPGVVALVTDREHVLYRGAFGVADVSSKRPMAVDSMFRIASMTKAITSLALMQLVEQGKLGLEDPVDKYLPEMSKLPVFESFDATTGAYKLRPSTKPITVRHVLTHTSGLGYPFTSATLRDFKPRTGEQYADGPLLFEPGERWHYGTSTDIVGRLVEKVSGEKLEDYFRAHIFAPLEMTDTSYNIPEAKAGRVVAAQQRDGEQMDGKIVLQSPQPGLAVPMPIGGGGLTSTVDDYGRFVRMLLDGGALDGARVLKPETVALMGKNAIGNVSVPALETALPRSEDFTFINDGRDKWGLGFLITVDQVPGKRSPGSLSWGGINNTYLLDRSEPRDRGRDHDAVSAVRRCQGARGLRRVRAGGLSESRDGGIALIAAGASVRTRRRRVRSTGAVKPSRRDARVALETGTTMRAFVQCSLASISFAAMPSGRAIRPRPEAIQPEDIEEVIVRGGKIAEPVSAWSCSGRTDDLNNLFTELNERERRDVACQTSSRPAVEPRALAGLGPEVERVATGAFQLLRGPSVRDQRCAGSQEVAPPQRWPVPK